MKGYLIPLIDDYYNLTMGKAYDIIDVTNSNSLAYYFYDDNNNLTVLVKEMAEKSFEIHLSPLEA